MLNLDISPDTRAIADRLREVPIDGIITLDDISAVIGRDIRTCRNLFYSAQKIVNKEAGLVFATERGVGYRRVGAEHSHKIGIRARKTIRGTARRARRQITHAIRGANDMSDDAKRKVYSEINSLAFIEMVSRDSNQPAEDVKAPSKPEPVGVTARRMIALLTGDESLNPDSDGKGTKK